MVQRRQFFQTTLTLGPQAYLDLAAVRGAPRSIYPSIRFALQDSGECAMGLRLQPLGDLSDRDPVSARKAAYMKHDLVLERGHTLLAADHLAETEKSPQLVAKFRQCLVLSLGKLF